MKRRIVSAAALCFLCACSRHERRPESVAAQETRTEIHGARVKLPAGSPQLSAIRVAGVSAARIPSDEVVAPGKVVINPNRISRVAPPLPGRIAAVEVHFGDPVTQGQPLLWLESHEAEEAISNSHHAEAQLRQARAALSKSRADQQRVKDLFEHDAAPRKDMVNAEAELAQAEAALQEAQAALEQSHRRLTLLGLKPAEFGQKVVVRAPISGKVLEISAVPGEFRNDTNAPLLTIADLSTVWVTSDVPESAIRWIQVGERVQIELSAYPGELFHGRVTRIADTLNPQSRTLEVQTELANPQGKLRPEMFARIRHSHGTRETPALPSAAVVRAEGATWVFVERARGEYERVRIETGENVGDLVPVLSGLPANAPVVVDGAMLLQGLLGAGR